METHSSNGLDNRGRPRTHESKPSVVLSQWASCRCLLTSDPSFSSLSHQTPYQQLSRRPSAVGWSCRGVRLLRPSSQALLMVLAPPHQPTRSLVFEAYTQRALSLAPLESPDAEGTLGMEPQPLPCQQGLLGPLLILACSPGYSG